MTKKQQVMTKTLRQQIHLLRRALQIAVQRAAASEALRRQFQNDLHYFEAKLAFCLRPQ